MDMKKDKCNVPDVGTIVEYGLDSFGNGPETWRVDGWLRVAPKRPKFLKEEWIEKILFKSCQKINGHRMQFCLRNEATHLALSGVCGRIALIKKCKVVGRVDWPEETIEEQRRSAIRLGKNHEMIF
jgi:hypothetical protein